MNLVGSVVMAYHLGFVDCCINYCQLYSCSIHLYPYLCDMCKACTYVKHLTNVSCCFTPHTILCRVFEVNSSLDCYMSQYYRQEDE